MFVCIIPSQRKDVVVWYAPTLDIVYLRWYRQLTNCCCVWPFSSLFRVPWMEGKTRDNAPFLYQKGIWMSSFRKEEAAPRYCRWRWHYSAIYIYVNIYIYIKIHVWGQNICINTNKCTVSLIAGKERNNFHIMFTTVCITIHSPWRHCHGILSSLWAFGHFGDFDGDILWQFRCLWEGQSEVTAEGGAPR